MKYIKGLDTLRAFAIIFVLIEHWWLPISFDFKYWINGLIPNGGFGVHLFFVLSGFLITTILLQAIKNKEAKKMVIIRNFIIRRALRIFPLYYLTIIFLLFIDYPFKEGSLPYITLYLSNILIYQTKSFFEFSYSWSLAVEEQFYLIWPWLIVFIKEKHLKIIFIVSILVGVLTTFYTVIILGNWAGSFLMFSCMQSFGIGGGYAYLKNNDKLKHFSKLIKISVLVALFFHFYWAFNPEIANKNSFWFLTINSIISIWIIHLIIHNKSLFIKKYFLENRVLNKIGQISYGIYLFHVVLHFVYEKLIKWIFNDAGDIQIILLDWKNSYFIKLFLLFFLALVSYQYFEKPILKLKNRFNY